MDPIIWIFSIAMAILLTASMAPNLLLRLGGKIQDGGIIESSKQARKVVTIEDVAERKFFTEVKREERDNGTHHLTLLNLDTRTIEYRSGVTAEMLKVNLFEAMDTGFLNIRLIPVEGVESEFKTPMPVTAEDTHPQYTKDELRDQSRDAYDKWKLAESEVIALKATTEEQVNNRVDQAARLTSSAKERKLGQGR